MQQDNHSGTSELERAKRQLLQSFDFLYEFSGFGHLEVDMKILKRGQKEVLIRCGREYRFVLDTNVCMILPDALKIKMEFYYTCLNFSLIFHVENV